MKDFLERRFSGKDVFIVGGGSSLIGFDFNSLNGRRVIALNHSYEYCKPNLIIYLDTHFIKKLNEKGHRFDALPAPVLSGPKGEHAPGGCYWVKHVSHPQFNNSNGLFSMTSTGHFGISAALLGDARRVYLLGFDCHAELGIHFYDKDWESRKIEHGASSNKYRNMITGFDLFLGYGHEKIINLSITSKIRPFKKIDLKEFKWPVQELVKAL